MQVVSVRLQTMYVVRYTGPFGFIKPWTAVRDGTTYSQSFLTPSIVEGLRQKLDVSAISRHRLRHEGISLQQERTQSADWKMDSRQAVRPLSIITRGVMVQPTLVLAFESSQEAEQAATQHICLCRNEDLLLPLDVREMSTDAFEALPGVELMFGQAEDAFLVGFNRFEAAAPMYGRLVVVDQWANEEEIA
jgi:hypothetical protein